MKAIMSNIKMMTNLLITTSAIMFVSVFTGIPKVLGVTLTIWILNIGWIMYLLLGDTKISRLVEVNEEKIDQLKENKKYAEVGIRLIAIPFVVIGLIVVFFNVASLFVM